ncbi:MAG TPA: hypothetical protein VG892_14275 [Terriglobales bacterium]|nr:hypothetical protein [Terriglobales bacterium]
MSEEQDDAVREGSGLRTVIMVIGALYVLGSLYVGYTLQNRLEKLERIQTATAAQNGEEIAKISRRLGLNESSLKSSTETLTSRLGLTQQEIKARAAELQHQQKIAEERLANEQRTQITAVSGEVAGVRNDLGGAKSDIASTRTDLEATKNKLERALGDLGVQSGLIAHTRDELEVLKHRGDRNYFEFTLQKGSKPAPISTVSLQLKKVDAKKGKFTVNVLADDRVIEKKDRTLNEPLQFYTGRDRNLYEMVVFTAAKNQISGYLSTPKSLPATASP